VFAEAVTFKDSCLPGTT